MRQIRSELTAKAKMALRMAYGRVTVEGARCVDQRRTIAWTSEGEKEPIGLSANTGLMCWVMMVWSRAQDDPRLRGFESSHLAATSSNGVAASRGSIHRPCR
jgi:hypothetical protein